VRATVTIGNDEIGSETGRSTYDRFVGRIVPFHRRSHSQADFPRAGFGACLNRRFAPELYIDVCAVTLDNGVARISGGGEVIDHAVRMRQFRAEDELDRPLATGAVAPLDLEGFGGACRHGPAAPWLSCGLRKSIEFKNISESLHSRPRPVDPHCLFPGER